MNNLPLVNFHFQVDWGGTRIGFVEVTGLDIQQQVIEYRDGSDPEYSTRKLPGMRKFSNITLKRGIFKNDNEFFQWYNTISLNTVEKRDIIISLLNEEHEPIVIWKAINAWPMSIKSPKLHATDSEVAIESMEIAHEGLVIQHN
jgi:phage tail-like protein